MNGATFLAKLKIENFPSRVELLNLIDSFLSSSEYPTTYRAINQDNLIILMLHNPDVAYAIIKRLKTEQIKNSLYSKIKTSLVLTPLNQNPSKSFEKTKSTATLNTSGIKKTKGSSLTKKKKINTETNVVRLKVNNNKNKKVFTSMFLGQTPYMDENDRRKLEEKKSKLLWIDKRGFNQFVGKATTHRNENYISNYVNETPSEPPVTYKFREIHKEKWIGKSTFFL